MIIGTLTAEEAHVMDSHEGYHRFHAPESQEAYGSFEVFWPWEGGHGEGAGWYWWSCFPGCLPDGERNGPFGSSQAAHEDADEWSPEYDD